MSSPITFCILAHDDLPLLRRLCRALAPYPVHIHIDAKANALSPADLSDLTNVASATKQVPVYWADYSMVEAIFLLLQKARETSDAGHTLLLSGSCYPTRPVDELVEMLSRSPDQDVIQMVKVEDKSWLNVQVARKWRMRPYLPDRARSRFRTLATADDLVRRVRNRIAREIPRHFRREIGGRQLYTGSVWWALSPASRDYLVDLWRKQPNWLQPFKSTYAVDEMIVPTLLGNSPRHGLQTGPTEDKGSQMLYDAPLHFVYPDNGRWIEDTPCTRAAIADSGKFFARKLSSTKNAELLEWLDMRLQKREISVVQET